MCADLISGPRVVLFHKFFFDEEPGVRARDRLKKYCDWIARNFRPFNLQEFQKRQLSSSLPSNAILLTIDDAKLELLSVLDVFNSFAIPICVFACIGWCAQESAATADQQIALAKLIADIQWYDGSPATIPFGNKRISIGGSPQQTAQAIDCVLACADQAIACPVVPTQPEKRRVRVCCSLDELAGIASPEVAIAGHSLSHVNLAQTSALRLQHEVHATRNILARLTGGCEAFAYPYGTDETHNADTRRALQQAGFKLAFLSHSELVTRDTDPFELPRISLPDRALSQAEFRARVAGAGIFVRRLKQTMRRA